MSLAKLKANRQSFLEKINAEIQKVNSRGFEEDNRFWQPTVDKNGNGTAIIRFLPAPEGEDIPFVRVFSHSFQGPTGMWYIENSLTTIGKDDPVSEYNSRLWETGTEENKNIARKQKRKLHFISNIEVVKDPANPENEGKVFLFKYGKKIFDKINDAMKPEFEDETPLNAFDMWEGAPLRLVIRNVDDFRNYDKSTFDKPCPVRETDEEIEALWKQCHSLQEFLDPKNFKSYEELQARLNRVLGLGSAPRTTAASASADVEEVAAPRTPKAAKPAVDDDPPFDLDETDDDNIDFSKLLGDD